MVYVAHDQDEAMAMADRVADQGMSDQGGASGFVRPQHVRLGVEGGLPAWVEGYSFRGERHVIALR